MNNKLKEALLIGAKKNRLLMFAKHGYKWAAGLYLSTAIKLSKVQEQTVLFEAFRSTKYADTPRALYEHMLTSSDFKDFRFIWSFEDPSEHTELLKNPRTRLVRHETFSYYMAFARAKYWVVNGWIPLKAKKRAGQIALQCWHGTPLKRLRYDIKTNQTTEHKLNSMRDNDLDIVRYDFFVSPSKFATKVFTSAFNLKKLGKSNILIETGYPRNDPLIKLTNERIAQLRKKYNIPFGKKVALYAPTWRDDQHVAGKGYAYSTSVDFSRLKDELSNEYVMLFRAHNLVTNNQVSTLTNDFLIDVSAVDDINELYSIADVLITDYSSVFFDYANLRRPIIFFMYDFDRYKEELRGFYLDTSTLPGAVLKTEGEVVEALRDLEAYMKQHAESYEKFNKTFNYLDDGQATSRVIDIVFGARSK